MTASKKTERKTVSGLPAGAVLALIAGGGSLPVELASRLGDLNFKTIVMPIAGETDGAASFPDHDTRPIAMEDFGNLVTRLKRHGVTHVLMAGTVRRRPRLTSMRLGLGLFKAFADVAWALAKGDDSLLTAVIGHLEKAGITVIAAQDIFPELLTEAGLLSGRHPTRRDLADIDAAVAAARSIGALDIGQAAIAIGGRVVALEGVEGTDGLLERTIELRQHGRLAGARGGVLVKCAKPGQELRADLPAIGPGTVEAAARAGLAGVALEVGRSLILERERTMHLSRHHKVFIYGIEAQK